MIHSQTVVKVIEMRRVTSSALALVVLAMAACGQTGGQAPSEQAAAPADLTGPWTLDSASSKIAFASIKSGELIETHYFPGLSGSVTASGEASVTIPLDQVETKIDQRNARMRTMFFETDQFPVAEIRALVDPGAFSDLAIGARFTTELEGSLSLHGTSSSVFAEVFVTRIGARRIEVATSEPVIVHVADHNLEAGLEALREIANLPAITPAVPVTFTLVFESDSDD